MISIIVPVYNVETYLPRCLDSILTQSLEDFELLLIDDGSTDGSGKICDQYAERDRRIVVFHKSNGGLSDARNYALNRMKGQLVTFIDSDDYVGRDYLKILLEMIEEYDVDFTSLGMEETWSTEMTFVESNDERRVLSRQEAYREMAAGTSIGVMSCAKLFKAELFDGIRFPVGEIYEDLATIPYVISRCDRCVASSVRQYYYYQRPDSLSNTVSRKNVDMWIKTMEKLLNWTEEEFTSAYPFAESRLVRTTFWWILDRLVFSDLYIETAKRLKKRWGAHFIKAWRLPCLTTKERFKVTSFMINIRLFRMIRMRIFKRK